MPYLTPNIFINNVRNRALARFSNDVFLREKRHQLKCLTKTGAFKGACLFFFGKYQPCRNFDVQAWLSHHLQCKDIRITTQMHLQITALW